MNEFSRDMHAHEQWADVKNTWLDGAGTNIVYIVYICNYHFIIMKSKCKRRFLAGELGVSQSAIEVVFGRMNANRQLQIKAPARLPACIALPLASAATSSAAPSRRSR